MIKDMCLTNLANTIMPENSFPKHSLTFMAIIFMLIFNMPVFIIENTVYFAFFIKWIPKRYRENTAQH